MKVLITGLEGFTGRYLEAELSAAGHEVVGLKSDLTDERALNAELKQLQPDWVAHLAGIAFVGHGEPNDFYRVNLMGTRNLLEALAQCGKVPRCVLLTSSANVYGNSFEGRLSEDTPLAPSNDYAVSKLAMEQMASLWFDRFPIVIARPFNYTGLGQSEAFLLPKIVAHFGRRADVIELGNLDIWRDFSDVRAVVKAYHSLLDACPAGEVVNVCSGHAYSLREILTLVAKIFGYTIDVRVNPAFVRTNEVKTLCGDSSKLNKIVGSWTPIPIEETLKWMASNSLHPCP